jgi:undecaprenyl-diphosphatase
MNFLHAYILGLVEGVTEFLPISSTAHLGITTWLLHISETEFVKTFEISIQLGAILAVVIFFAKRFGKDIEVWKRVIVAFLPTAAIGFVLYKLIKHVLLGNQIVIISALALGGVLLILFELYMAKRGDQGQAVVQELETLSYKNAFTIGLVQSLAVIPGVSRAAATIITGRLLGMSRIAVVEFSFLLAVPTVAAAALYDLYKSAHTFTPHEFSLLTVGFVVACVSALLAIKFFLQFIQKRSFVSFGVYRIILAIVLIFLFIL